MTGDPTDEKLMAAVTTGDRDALNVLLRRHAHSLLTFLLRLTGHRHRAEEIFQEVFLALWITRRRYRYPRPFQPWLFGIAMNKCRAEYRRFRREPAPFSTVSDDCPTAVDCPSTDDCPPKDPVVEAETTALVMNALDRLSNGQREVVVLRIWQNLSYSEIANQLLCSESNVRSQMYHGLAVLRRYLEPRMRDE